MTEGMAFCNLKYMNTHTSYTRIILARHGRSEAAEKGLVQGQGLNVPMTEEGRKQAEALARFLADFSFGKIYASTALRAIETARLIRAFHKETPYEEIAELNERSKGVSEGMTQTECRQKYPDIEAQWNQELDARPKGGENFEDVARRAVPLIERHLKEHPFGTTLLYVGHGNVFRSLIGHALNMEHRYRPRIQLHYCAVSALHYDHERKRWIVEYVNRVPALSSICP
ncbi:MAG: putative phosphoglycerate mutase [Parcubacteria group bacterium Gr01-1014_33]|nr:MAG: putative phosphoglycerate mutase [Parcubacteria group bacterium Gr01-1014_33]